MGLAQVPESGIGISSSSTDASGLTTSVGLAAGRIMSPSRPPERKPRRSDIRPQKRRLNSGTLWLQRKAKLFAGMTPHRPGPPTSPVTDGQDYRFRGVGRDVVAYVPDVRRLVTRSKRLNPTATASTSDGLAPARIGWTSRLKRNRRLQGVPREVIHIGRRQHRAREGQTLSGVVSYFKGRRALRAMLSGAQSGAASSSACGRRCPARGSEGGSG